MPLPSAGLILLATSAVADLHVFVETASPDQAVVTATLGLCLIFWELNRPGRILPGALGLTLTLLAGAALARYRLQPWTLLLLLSAAVIFGANLWRALPAAVLALATAATILAFHSLLVPDQPAGVRLATALPCGLLLGAITSVLTRIAFRARRAKALD